MLTSKWTRPYERHRDDLYALRYIVAGVMSVVGLFPLCGFAMGELTPAAAPFIIAFVMIWELALWRVTLTGVYVCDTGVKIRMVLRSHVIPWPRLARAWAGPAAHYDAWQIWISTRGPDRDLETPLWRRGSRTSHRNHILLPPEEFAAVLEKLNARR